MSVVLDSSVTLARIFPDEWTPEILGVFSDAAVFSAWVPGLWKIELANVLSLSVRKGRMTQQRRDEVLFDLNFLDIVVDLETSDKAWGNTLQLADKYKLTDITVDGRKAVLATSKDRLGLYVGNIDPNAKTPIKLSIDVSCKPADAKQAETLLRSIKFGQASPKGKL